MKYSISPLCLGKQNLPLFAMLFVFHVTFSSGVVGQATTSWQGQGGANDVWTRPENWTNGVPTVIDTAVISSGSGTTLALREGTLAGGVSVGTLLLTNPTYTNIVTGASAASMNFSSGTSEIAYAPTSTSNSTLTIGGQSQRLRLNIGSQLNLTTTPTNALSLQSSIHGGGQLVLINSNIGLGPAQFVLGAGTINGPASQSTFSGGVTATAGVAIIVGDVATSTAGPLGTGTLTMEGGSVLEGLASTGSVIIGNPVQLPTSVLLTRGSVDLTFDKPVYSSGSLNIQGLPGSSHTLTFNQPITATSLLMNGTGAPNVGLVLNSDSTSTLTGTISFPSQLVQVRQNGALGSSSHPTLITSNTSLQQETQNATLQFAGSVDYTTPELVKVFTNFQEDVVTIHSVGAAHNKFAGHIEVQQIKMSSPILLAMHVDTGGTFTMSGTLEMAPGGAQTSVVSTGDGWLKFHDTILLGKSGIDGIGGTNANVHITSGENKFEGNFGYFGQIVKTGTGSFTANHFFAGALTIDEGSLHVFQEGSNIFGGSGNTHRSSVNTLNLAGGNSPTVKLDLSNNELVIDYTGTSPIGTINVAGGTIAGIAAQIRSAYLGNGTSQVGSWVGNGITSASANAGSYAIGYGEASALGLGTGTFRGQTLDNTSLLIAFTYYGDFNLNGQANTGDFQIYAPNHNTAQPWTGGDANYDGIANITDFGLMAANYNADVIARGTSPLLGLYVLLLDWPAIYWDAKDRPDIWWRFEPFELLNLGAVPPRPEGNRSVPEPAAALVLAATALLRRRSLGR